MEPNREPSPRGGIGASPFDRLRDPVLLGLRVVMGWLFFATGTGKLGDLPATTEFFAGLGLPLPSVNALLVGALEAVGGALLAVGFGGRITALLLTGNMVVAYLTAHAADLGTVRTFVAAAPYPFLTAALVVLAFGPGRLSLDALLRHRRCASRMAVQAGARA